MFQVALDGVEGTDGAGPRRLLTTGNAYDGMEWTVLVCNDLSWNEFHWRIINCLGEEYIRSKQIGMNCTGLEHNALVCNEMDWSGQVEMHYFKII